MATRIPISKDNFDFDDGQDSIWDRMERDMERRRKEWEDEIDRMRQDFFHMRPEDRNYDAMSDRLMRRLADPGQREEVTSAIETDANGRPVFRVRFDVHDYKPEEVHVKTDAHKVLVYAKHEEKGGSASVSREFSREVNIPREIDPLDLQCIMGQDGILTLEAPLPTPGYAAVRDAAGSQPERLPPHQERPHPHQERPHHQLHQAPETKVSSVSFQTGPAPSYPDTAHSSASSAFHAQPHSQLFSAPPPASMSSPHSSMGASSGTSTTSSSKYQSAVPSPYSGSGVATSSYQQQQQQQQQQQAYPGFSTPPRPAATLLSSSASTWTPVSSEKDSKFKLDIDIEDFAPEDLLVKTMDKKLVISARREEKVGNRTSTKELSREYHIPDTVDPYTVKAFFVDGGRLVVEAPIRAQPLAANGGFPRSGSPLSGR